jgi:hypothetical protein
MIEAKENLPCLMLLGLGYFVFALYLGHKPLKSPVDLKVLVLQRAYVYVFMYMMGTRKTHALINFINHLENEKHIQVKLHSSFSGFYLKTENLYIDLLLHSIWQHYS